MFTDSYLVNRLTCKWPFISYIYTMFEWTQLNRKCTRVCVCVNVSKFGYNESWLNVLYDLRKFKNVTFCWKRCSLCVARELNGAHIDIQSTRCGKHHKRIKFIAAIDIIVAWNLRYTRITIIKSWINEFVILNELTTIKCISLNANRCR